MFKAYIEILDAEKQLLANYWGEPTDAPPIGTNIWVQGQSRRVTAVEWWFRASDQVNIKVIVTQ